MAGSEKNKGNGSDQSASMGRSDDENAGDNGDNAPVNDDNVTEDFLDEDYLSFDNVANGGTNNDAKNGKHINGGGTDDNAVRDQLISESNGNGAAGNYERRNTSQPQMNNNGGNNGKNIANKVTIPWLDNTNSFPQQQQQQGMRQNQYQQQQQPNSRQQGRGYNSNVNINNNRNQYYERPPPPPLIKLHNEIVSFMSLMAPTKEELKVRDVMVERVTKLAQKVFGGKDKCQVLPFGSQVTGLCLPNSDIDFVIRFPEADKKNNDDVAKNGKDDSKPPEKGKDEEDDEDLTDVYSNPLHAFADAVRSEFGIRSELEMITNDDDDDDDDTEHLTYLEVIEQTRVPLVKFTVAPYNIDIDVCFNQPGGPESAELMHRFMDSMPPLRPLTFVLKYFLASREINKPFTGGIGSYLLQLMIVSFLQHRAREDLKRDGRMSSVGSHFNLGSLLLDFFELYGLDFNYVTTGISVRVDGYYFPKGDRERKPIFWQPQRPLSLAVENPLDVSADVGGGAYRIQMIQRVFEHAFKTVMAYVSEPREETESILAKIIPPTEEMEKRMVFKKVSIIEEAVAVATGGNGAAVANGNNENEKSSRKKKRKSDKRDSDGGRKEKRRSI